MPDRIRTFLIVTSSVVGILVVLEAGVRLFGPPIPEVGTDRTLVADSVFGSSRGLRPGSSGTSNGARVDVDARGLIHYGSSRAEGAPGWLFLGDSVTMGIGVDPDSTFAGWVAAETDSLEVWNPSLIGYAVDDYARVFDSFAGNPDLRRVTLFWCLNDVYPDGKAGDPGSLVRMTGGRLLRWIQRNYRTYHWLKALVMDRPRSYFEYVNGRYESDPGLVEEAVAGIRRMKMVAEREGVEFAVVLLPYEYQLREPGHMGPQEMLVDLLADDSMAVYEPSSYLRDGGIRTSDLYLFGDGIHFSATGHRALARFIGARFLPSHDG